MTREEAKAFGVKSFQLGDKMEGLRAKYNAAPSAERLAAYQAAIDEYEAHIASADKKGT